MMLFWMHTLSWFNSSFTFCHLIYSCWQPRILSISLQRWMWTIQKPWNIYWQSYPKLASKHTLKLDKLAWHTFLYAAPWLAEAQVCIAPTIGWGTFLCRFPCLWLVVAQILYLYCRLVLAGLICPVTWHRVFICSAVNCL
jgi:hypothetical protein